MTNHKFKVGHLCGGSGFGARGMGEASARHGQHVAHFECAGSVDFDALANEDFRRLAGGRTLTADLHELQPADLRAFMGERAPDLMFSSPPCKAFSQLLSVEKSLTEDYQRMAKLFLRCLFLSVEAWPESPPGLLIFENVPAIATRGAELLEQARKYLMGAGYRFDERIFDCGEIGGLAQHRRRFTLVARHQVKVPQEVFTPPLQRVRACGEVLGPLPLPNDPAGGPLHKLPEISLLTWLRLAFIPAGGDWRDLPSSAASYADGRLSTPLKPGQKRGEVFSRYHVGGWKKTARTVAGDGTNGGFGVSDPRIVPLPLDHAPRRGTMGVTGMGEPAATVRGRADVRTGEAAVADDRLAQLQLPTDNPGRHWNKYAVRGFEQPALTVTGTDGRVGSGAPSVADDRLARLSGGDAAWNDGAYGVEGWARAAHTITAGANPSTGTKSVADPRLAPLQLGQTGAAAGDWKGRPGLMGVNAWDAPSATVSGKAGVTQSNMPAAVSDERLGRVPLTCKAHGGAYGVTSLDEAADTVTGSACIDNGRVAVADEMPAPPLPPGYRLLSVEAALDMLARGEKLKKGEAAVIASPHDGHWHRPITDLELAVLQSMPAVLDGKPLVLAGTSRAKIREHIGNAVPSDSAKAWGGSFLSALLRSALGVFALSAAGLWVEQRPDFEERASRAVG